MELLYTYIYNERWRWKVEVRRMGRDWGRRFKVWSL